MTARLLTIALALLAAAHAAAQTTRVNVVTTPGCVESNGYISALVTPGTGEIVGEPGAVFARIGSNEVPSKIVTVLNGRVNPGGNVNWSYYAQHSDHLSRFYLRIYSANTNSGYLANGPYIEFQLAHPVDSNNAEVTTLFVGGSTIPNLPAFAAVHPTNTNDLERLGYWFGFNLTTDTGAVNATAALIPTNVLSLMRTDPDGYVMTFHVKSVLALDGGVRIGIQEPGYGQGALRPGVFSSGAQPRAYTDPAIASYALGLEIVTEQAGQTGQTNVPVLVALDAPWTGAAGLTVTNLVAGQTNTVSMSTAMSGPWQTTTVFVATGDTQTVQAPATNAAAYYRIEHGP